jgi:hypothetical protein
MSKLMKRLTLTKRTNLTLQLSNPRLTNRSKGIQGIVVNNLPQTNPGLQHPTGWDLLFHPISKKPGRMTEENMKQENSQVAQHIQDFGTELVW